ncbi:MAG TPA: hypothetical protein VFH63_06665 [candidate division Zixibacteria bacterium]|nr:hypothetical protein [candidate division Zixibacteria bacterium]
MPTWAPDVPDDGVLSTRITSGRIEERRLPSGSTEVRSLDHPGLPAEEVAAVIERVRQAMAAA